jgi:hypothetical protein
MARNLKIKINMTIPIVLHELKKGLTLEAIGEKYGYSKNWIWLVVKDDETYNSIYKNIPKVKSEFKKKIECRDETIIKSYKALTESGVEPKKVVEVLQTLHKITYHRTMAIIKQQQKILDSNNKPT